MIATVRVATDGQAGPQAQWPGKRPGEVVGRLAVMGWRRAAIAGCAVVGAAAGVVSVAADAVDADQDPASYLAAATFSVDKLNGSCPSFPAPAPAPLFQASCDGEVRLPVGASESEVIGALGEPQSRRSLGADGEAWSYTWQYDGPGLQELAQATLRFDGHRLVDSVEYIFK